MLGFLLMAVALGLGGSVHCLAMCGPLVMRMPFAASGGVLGSSALYHIGKATAYGLLGALFGLVGKGFLLFNWQQVLSVMAGIVVLLFAFLPSVQKKISGNFPFAKQLNKTLLAIHKKPAAWHFVVFGFFNGFLPCGLVYTALAGATAIASPLYSFVFMFVFGMGTVPALSIVSVFNGSLRGDIKRRIAKVSTVLSLLIGVLLILRGLNLNIPYVSPYFSVPGQPVECHP